MERNSIHASLHLFLHDFLGNIMPMYFSESVMQLPLHFLLACPRRPHCPSPCPWTSQGSVPPRLEGDGDLLAGVVRVVLPNLFLGGGCDAEEGDEVDPFVTQQR